METWANGVCVDVYVDRCSQIDTRRHSQTLADNGQTTDTDIDTDKHRQKKDSDTDTVFRTHILPDNSELHQSVATSVFFCSSLGDCELLLAVNWCVCVSWCVRVCVHWVCVRTQSDDNMRDPGVRERERSK